MAVDLLDHEAGPGAPEGPRPPARRARRWVAGLAAFLVVAGVLGLVANDEVRANTRFDGSHAALPVTRQRTAAVRADLTTVRNGLHVVDGQVAQDRVALARDTTQLQQVVQALADARANLDRQTRDASDLRTCLSGVEQALNALSVADRGHAISALGAVAAACNAAVSANG